MTKRGAVIRRADENQPEVVNGLREAGYSVCDIHIVGCGVPDLIVARDGKTVLVEVKRTWLSPMSEDEHVFFQTWQGDKIVATCAKEVMDWFSERKAAT